MISLLSRRIIRLSILIIPFAALTTTTSRADWTGSEKSIDGAVHVMNPATPIEPAKKIPAKELWRVGGDDEDVLFGVITSIAVDNIGNVYLLDAQINVVHVFSPDGEFLREIGQEGEGPGEFRRAEDLFLTGDGNIGVMQRRPGKIIQMTTEGDPLENYKLPSGDDGAPMFITGGVLTDGGLIISTRGFKRNDNGFSITRSLVRIDGNGEITATYRSSERERNMADFSFDEKTDAEPLFTAASDGRVFIHDDWDAYAINVYDESGKLDRVIERDFKPRKRTAEEMEANKPRVMMRGGGHRREAESTAAETDRNIREMFVRDDGMLWVVNSRGGADSPDGTVATFDVFDTGGRFVESISIACDADFIQDGLHFVGDKLIIVKGLRTSREAMYARFGGGDDTADDDEDVEPLSVVCYDLSNIVSARK